MIRRPPRSTLFPYTDALPISGSSRGSQSCERPAGAASGAADFPPSSAPPARWQRSEEHTSELQSRGHLVCRLLLEKKKIYSCDYRYGWESRTYISQRALSVDH